jgi:hypothetical protein
MLVTYRMKEECRHRDAFLVSAQRSHTARDTNQDSDAVQRSIATPGRDFATLLDGCVAEFVGSKALRHAKDRTEIFGIPVAGPVGDFGQGKTGLAQ